MVKIFLNYFRVKEWLHILGLPILGFIYSNGLNLFSKEFISALFLSSLLLSFAYSFDKYYDRTKNNRAFDKKLIPSIASMIASVIYASYLSNTILSLTVIDILIVIFYVLPPFRLKGAPIFVTVLNSLGFTMLFLIGYSTNSNINSNTLLFSGLIALIMIPIQLVHELAHFDKDKKMGLNTTAINFGQKITKSLISYSLILVIFWGIVLYFYGIVSILLIILLTSFAISLEMILKYEKNTLKARVYLRYLSIAIGLVFLMFFIFKI